MPRKKWWAGKTVNPEFKEAARAHARECSYCGSETWTSRAEHNQWRNIAESHIGRALPPTFVDEEPEAPKVNRNVSRLQGNIALDIEARKYD